VSFTHTEIATLEEHHNALVYVREDVPIGDIVYEKTSVEPLSQLLFASTETWRRILKMIAQTYARPSVDKSQESSSVIIKGRG